MAGKSGVSVSVKFNHLPALSQRMREQGAAHVQATAEHIAEDAASRAPVDTGELRDSIHVEGRGMASVIVADAGHAAYVEYGTSRSPAQPYLHPAVEAARSGYLSGWKSIISGGGLLGALRSIPSRLALGRQSRARVR